MPNPINVMTGNAEPIVAAGILTSFLGKSHISSVGNFTTLRKAMELLERNPTDVLMLDTNLNESVLDFIRHCQATRNAVRILITSRYEDVRVAQRHLGAGAVGFLSRSEPLDSYSRAVEKAHSKSGYWLNDTHQSQLLSHERSEDPLTNLSDREWEVFIRYGRGKTTNEIAVALNIGSSSVGTYRDSVRQKLGIEGTTQFWTDAIRYERTGKLEL